jgi:hypothetical protein
MNLEGFKELLLVVLSKYKDWKMTYIARNGRLFRLSTRINESQVSTDDIPGDGRFGVCIETVLVETTLTEGGSLNSWLRFEPESIDSCALETFPEVFVRSSCVGSPALRCGQECCLEEELGVLYG